MLFYLVLFLVVAYGIGALVNWNHNTNKFGWDWPVKAYKKLFS